MNRHLPFLLLLCFLIPACGGKQDNDGENDSISLNDSDSILMDTLEEPATYVAVPPKKADELFDDFVYAFMRNKHFQRSRIDFPLKNTTSNGAVEKIERKEWTHDALYSGRNIYMMISTSAKAAEVSKDTSINDVMVHEIHPVTHAVKQYAFHRRDTQWRLTEIKHGLVENIGEGVDFMPFYCRFTTDSVYQQSHISDIVSVNTFDEEQGEQLEGTINASQWAEFAPQFPKDEIMCVRYGHDFKTSNQRIVNLASPSGDAGVTLYFHKKNGEWYLTRYEN